MDVLSKIHEEAAKKDETVTSEEKPATDESVTEDVKEEADSQKERVVYEEEVEVEAEPEAPAEEESVPVVTAKDGDDVEDIPLLVDGKPNPRLKELVNMGKNFYRKTQDVAELRKELEARQAALEEKIDQGMTGNAERKAEAEVDTITDILADMDDDDPIVQDAKMRRKQISELKERLDKQNEVINRLETRLEINDKEQAQKRGERIVQKAMEDYPVLTERDIEDAIREYEDRLEADSGVKFETVAKERAEYLMERESGSVKKWKEKHQVKTKTPKNEGSSGAGAPAIKIDGKTLQSGVILDRIREDNAARRESTR